MRKCNGTIIGVTELDPFVGVARSGAMGSGELNSGFEHGNCPLVIMNQQSGEGELKNLSGDAIFQVADWSSVVHSGCFSGVKGLFTFLSVLVAGLECVCEVRDTDEIQVSEPLPQAAK